MKQPDDLAKVTNPDIPSFEGKPVVLLVDDDPDLRRLAETQLSLQGFEVIQAADGNEALGLAKSKSPDVILLDMMLPDISGADVLRELHADPVTEDIPVIFLSAVSGTAERVEGLESGAIDWITKPHEPNELAARVGAAARTKAKNEAIKSKIAPDPVTRLASRAAFEDRLGREVARSSRNGVPFAVFLLDIDRMAAINERIGTLRGDRLLREIAATMSGTLRHGDEIFRYGDDEIAVVLPDTDVATAVTAAERCRSAIATIGSSEIPTRVSIGIAQYSSGRTVSELISRCEIALFRAKESGGDRVWRSDDPRKHSLNPVALSEELTEREWDVVIHLCQRRTEQEIARRLGITRGTVRSHKARIRRKLHVSPDVRLSDFVRSNFRDLVGRLPVPGESTQ